MGDVGVNVNEGHNIHGQSENEVGGKGEVGMVELGMGETGVSETVQRGEWGTLNKAQFQGLNW